MADIRNTQFFQVEAGPQIEAKDIIELVFNALREKGYNPVNQIVGYIMSGDPTYITSYNGARSIIMKVERDELVEARSLCIGKFHCLLCGYFSRFPRGINLIPICGACERGTTKFLSLFLRCGNSFRLSLLDSCAFLFGNRSENFNQDVVYHLKNPLLTLR